MKDEVKKLEQELQRLIEHCVSELGAVRTNRPTPRLIEDIKAEHYGQLMTIKQLGSIMVISPREMTVAVWDKSAVPAVVKVIEAARLGLSVVVDGGAIRLLLPPLTDERRAELIKYSKAMVEKERIKARSMRDEINKKIKAIEHDEDVQFALKNEVQKLVDVVNIKFEALLADKLKEIQE